MPERFEQAPSARKTYGVVVMKPEDMAASKSGSDAVEFEQERSSEHDHDAAEAEIQSLVSQTQRRPLSRLQNLAPAKIQLKRLSPDSIGLSCRSPIPLLSPLLVSPLGDLDRLQFTEEAGNQNPEEEEENVVNAVISTRGWQHPAVPFFAERICSFSHSFAELCVQDSSWS